MVLSQIASDILVQLSQDTALASDSFGTAVPRYKWQLGKIASS